MKTIKKTAGILTIICLMIQSTQITCSSKPLTQQKITSYDVEQKINTLKTTIKSIKKLKTITALLIAGSAATTGISLIVAAALGLGISFFSGGIALAPTVKLCVGIAASGAIITATIPAQFLAIFGIGSTAGIITAFTQAQALQNIEKQNPGTLTEEQKLVVLQFKNLAQGDIVKGIIKGIKIKQALTFAIKSTLHQHPHLIQDLGQDDIKKASEKAFNIIKKYIGLQREYKNLTTVFNQYEQKKETYKQTKNENSQWSPKFHQANAKLIALNLNLKYLAIKMGKKKTESTIQKLDALYPNLKTMVLPFAKTFIQQAERIIIELEKPIL